MMTPSIGLFTAEWADGSHWSATVVEGNIA